MFLGKINTIKKHYLNSCQKVGALLNAPSKTQIQFMLLGIGVCLLSLGLAESAHAQAASRTIQIDNSAFRAATCAVFTYLEGSFGALVMVSSGVGAILSAAFGQYRAALGLMVVAIGSFIIRSLTAAFFGEQNTGGAANGTSCVGTR